MTFPEIKLVDSPSESAAVFFDFNDIDATPYRHVEADDFTIGVPELTGDVDAVDPMYGERTVSFTCQFRGTKPEVAAAQSTLARRLLAADQGWLWVRLTETSRLLFFRTYRAQPGDLSFELVQSTSDTRVETWRVQVSIPCEPFAYGERITQVAQTVGNDPASGGNRLRMELPAIVGDAPAQARIQTTMPTVWTSTSALIVVHANSAAAPSAYDKTVGTSDGLSAGTDTAAAASDSAAVGGTSRTVNFVTNAALTQRLIGSTPSLPPGQYKVLVRVDTGTTGVVSLRLRNVSASITGPIVTASDLERTGYQWVDLGDWNFPVRRPLSPGDMGVASTAQFALDAGRVSGSSDLRIDHIRFVPLRLAGTVEARALGGPSVGSFGSPASTGVFDGLYEDSWLALDNGAVAYAGRPAYGVYPRLVPGANHALFLFQNAGMAGDGITRSLSVVVSYYPRFLWVGDQ